MIYISDKKKKIW